MPTNAKKSKKNPKDLRWGFSTGASMSALALCAWNFLQYEKEITNIPVYFLDGYERLIPVLGQEEITSLGQKIMFPTCCNIKKIPSTTHSFSVALYKDGGDDPDCTHNALIYARLSEATIEEASENDYILPVNNASLIIKCVEGIGLCTREGLDCVQGKWAITDGPRQMLMKNLSRANMSNGVWLLEIGVHRGEILAKHTLNPLLGVTGGISLLGTTGLVRPYSHEAYLHTIHVCVKAHAIACQKMRTQGEQTYKTQMVFCTGGRTQKGAKKYFSHLPESAFTPIGDFIGESLKIACQYDMQTITVACMAGKLCKYAAGFTNTHAHKVEQDMDLLRAELRQCLKNENTLLCHSLQNAPTVREALLFIPKEIRIPLLEQLAVKALAQFRSWCGNRPELQILVFDFDGIFLFEKNVGGDCEAKPHYKLFNFDQNMHSTHITDDITENTAHTNSKITVTKEYFLEKSKAQAEGQA